MSKFVGLCALVMAVALVAVPAFAEVQNVKVSGDIDVKAITHHNFDLQGKQLNNPGGGQAGAGAFAVSNDDEGDVMLQTTRVRVDADLTDNVAATVRLLNQRFWDGQADGATINQIALDYGYVTLKELVYSPLTVRVGRQPLHFGTGFIVGDLGNLADPQGVFGGAAIGVGAGGVLAQEFSENNAYDAMRATLDFAPLVVDAIWSKINDTGITTNDQTLYGVNLNWKGTPVDKYNGEAELYWFLKDDQGFLTALHDNGRVMDSNTVHTVGGRVAGDPISNLHVNIEGAYQFGTLEDATTIAGQPYLERDRRAWALNTSARYTWANVPWTPMTGIGYVHYSGERGGSNSDLSADTDDFGAWDSMFRGEFFTAIQEFLAGTDATALYTTLDAADTAATTNRQILYGDVTVKPMQDVTALVRYSHIWFDHVPRIAVPASAPGTVPGSRGKSAGDEIDTRVTYDYTEDVQVGLIGAWFIPGSYYDDSITTPKGNQLAWELVGDLSVKF